VGSSVDSPAIIMSPAVTFIMIRFVHYLGLSVLFGVAFFQIYGVPPTTRRDLALTQVRPILLVRPS